MVLIICHSDAKGASQFRERIAAGEHIVHQHVFFYAVKTSPAGSKYHRWDACVA